MSMSTWNFTEPIGEADEYDTDEFGDEQIQAVEESLEDDWDPFDDPEFELEEERDPFGWNIADYLDYEAFDYEYD